ncbi:transposase [Streptomyces spectabilis]|uniref:transposase n=1 Tax=Streptomyces spectabilis TaxID=68270 RepID=UPI0028934845|nr:transposase [Streptomyces spectabilis]
MGFSRELRDLQLRVCAEQKTPEWKTRYAVRSGVAGTVHEFTHGHNMHYCRYRGQRSIHIQDVLAALAINIEHLSGLPATEEARPPRRPPGSQFGGGQVRCQLMAVGRGGGLAVVRARERRVHSKSAVDVLESQEAVAGEYRRT